jgi:subtilisin
MRFIRIAVAACVLLAFGVIGASAGGATTGAGAAGYIVVFKNSVSNPAALAAQQGKAKGFLPTFTYSHALKGYAASIPDAAVAAIQADPRVLYVSPEQEFQAATTIPPQQAQIVPFPVTRVGGDQSSTLSGDGQGSVDINVAVIDSGIDLTRPDLNVVGGVNCSNGQGYADVFGHGTQVSGTLAAKDNAIGVVGVAPGARLWSVRALNNQGGGSTSSILCAVEWVTATRTDNDPTNDIAVANMSLGGKGRDDGNCGLTRKDPFHQAICASTAAGVAYVAAASNEAEDIQQAVPASYDEVLTVTGIADSDGQPGGLGPSTWCLGDPDDSPAVFSNFATLPGDRAHTVAAVAECVASTFPGGLYGSGTSFATPAVAGVVALCIASGPCAGLTPAQIVQKIVGDAASYNIANPGYGFQGDPLRPTSGKYYGYLIRAALY